MDRDKVIKGLETCKKNDCSNCPYNLEAGVSNERVCLIDDLISDALVLLKEQGEERRRMLNWLGKFCRHIDNGDKWLPDEENIAFFREKMKRQFGWDVEDDA